MGAVIVGAYLAARPIASDPPETRTANSGAPSLSVPVHIRPASATVTVDGQPVSVVDGQITLEGPPGSTRVVRVTAEGREAREDVFIGLNGARPSQIDLPTAKTARAAEPEKTAEPATSQASSAPHPIATGANPTSRPTTTPPVLRDDR